MSETQQPTQPETQQATPTVTGDERALSPFLKISIVLLAVLSVASISLIFIGDFEGKFERVFSTFVVFAVFAGLTGADTRLGRRSEWYPPVALVANAYILALLLIVVWMTPAGWALSADIMWKSTVIVVATRAVLACAELLLRVGEGKPKTLGVFAMITSLFATLTGILFTAPIAIEVFRVNIPQLYWKFAVASLMLTALGLSITLLLRWAYSGAERDAKRQARTAQQAAAQQNAAQQGKALTQTANTAVDANSDLLPWPTFADGRPLPVGPDGQPDFSALNR